MSPQDWLILVAAASFLLIGVAVSPLAWLVLRQSRSDLEEQMDNRLQRQDFAIKTLHGRMDELEKALNALARPSQGMTGASRTSTDTGLGSFHQAEPQSSSFASARYDPPTLIAVPKLAASAQESDTNLAMLADRYAGIWQLADSGATADGIARVTGQPIGQVELILGLRRQLAVTRPPVKAHPPHVS